MSEFSVHRTADTIPALKYCLILDGERIAGGKPDYRGNNHLITWNTRETYGPVDQLKDENARLRELVRDYDKMLGLALADYRGFDAPLSDATHIALRTRMYNLKIEVAE